MVFGTSGDKFHMLIGNLRFHERVVYLSEGINSIESDSKALVKEKAVLGVSGIRWVPDLCLRFSTASVF